MGFVAPPSGCNDSVGAAPPPGGSNVTAVSYNTGTQILTVSTDQPAVYNTPIPLSLVTDNLDGTYTFDNQVDPPVTWNASGLVQTVTGYWVDNADPLNPVITVPKFNIATVPPTINNDSTQDYSVNSFWYQSNLNTFWVCLNPAAGAAQWSPVDNSNITNTVPSVNDDALDGYFPGYLWFNTVTSLLYVNISATAGAAVWFNVNPPGGISITATDPVVVTPTPITGVGVISLNLQHDATLTGNGSTGSPLSVVGTALEFALRVRAATTAPLPNTPVYNNGAGGVGATLTRTGNGALPAQDGITLLVGDRLLVKNQTAQLQNGVYIVTDVGGAGAPWILTRTTDSDATAELDNQVVVISEGTTQAGQIFAQQTLNPVVGTNVIVYTLVTGLYVTQQTTGTQVNRQIPWWTGVARQLSRGIAAFTFDTTNRLNVGTCRINSADGDIELIKNITYDWPAAQAVGTKLLTNTAGALTWSTDPYTNEMAQDAVGTILTDTDTIDFTYNDVANTITAAVRFQMSITSDVNGIKFVNDLTSPGNFQYYGTSGVGVRGWFSFNEQAQDAVGGILTDTNTIDMTYNDALNTITADVRTQMSITSDVNGIKFVNDVTSPGVLQYYGTNVGGVKGWYPNLSGLTSITVAAMTTLIATSTVMPGVFYLITDAALTDFGLIVQGADLNAISYNGTAGFLNADYQGAGVYSGVVGFVAQQGSWVAGNEVGIPYVNGDVVIWNNLHYQVTNSGAFAGTDPATNAAAYTLLSKTLTHGYIEEWDYVEYDIVHNWIDVRKDRRGNEIGGSWSYENFQASNGYNVIQRYQWGSERAVGNKCRESLCEIWNSSGSVFNNIISELSALRAATLVSGAFVNNIITKNANFVGTSIAGTVNGNYIEGATVAAANSQAIFTQNQIIDGASVDMTNFSNKQFVQNYVQGSTLIATNYGAAPGIKFNNNVIVNGCLIDFGNATANVINNRLSQAVVNGDTCASIFSTNDITNGQIDCQANTNWIASNVIRSATVMLTNSTNRFFTNTVDNITNADFTNNGGLISNCQFLSGATISGTNNVGDLSYITVEKGSTLTVTDNQSGIANLLITNNSTLDATNNQQQIFQGVISDTSIVFAGTNLANFSNFYVSKASAVNISGTVAGCTIDQIVVEMGSTLDAINCEGTISQLRVTESSNVNVPNMLGSLSGSTVQDRSTLNLLTQLSAGVFTGCSVSNGSVVSANINDGNIERCTFDSGINATVDRRTPSYSLVDCHFSNGFTVTILNSTTFRGEKLGRDFNTFYHTLDITGLTTMDMSSMTWVGKLILQSSNAAESIDQITNMNTEWPVRFYPEDGLDVTFVATPIAGAGADDIVLPGDANVTIKGRPSVSDFLTLQLENSINRFIQQSVI